MGLKDQIKADLSIFFNEDECAEWHTLNGARCLAIVDSDRLEKWKEVNLPMNISFPGQALADAEVFLFLQASSIPEPTVGEVLRYDGRPLRVQAAEIINGMLELVLGGNA